MSGGFTVKQILGKELYNKEILGKGLDKKEIKKHKQFSKNKKKLENKNMKNF